MIGIPDTLASLAVPIDTLVPYPKNPRRGDVVAIMESLKFHGQYRPIVVRESTREILAGNHTYLAAKQLGWTHIAATFQDCDDEEAARIVLVDNRSNDLATYDVEELLALAHGLPNLVGTGYDEQALADLAASLDTGDAGVAPEDDDIPDLPEDGPTRVQPGEVWALGDHRIACIDSTDKDAVQGFLAGQSVSMVWADPPYGISIVDVKGFVGGGAAYDIPFGGVKNESAAQRTKRLGSVGGSKPFGSKDARATVGGSGRNGIVKQGLYAPVIGDETADTAVDSATLCLDLFPKAVHFWWGANNYAFALPGTTCWIVWDKQNTGGFADAELAWSNHKSAVRIFHHQWSGLIKESERGEKRVHPTQKPVALAVWAFEKYGKDGDVVFDPFLGSGMSVIAAERTNRTVYGCELSPQYCDVILTRWEQLTGQTAERID